MMYHLQSPPPNPANAPSHRFFSEIGLTSGMRILDVGCGTGDLSRLVARLAGPDSVVVGIDRSEEALATAREAGAEPDESPVEYHRVDLASALPAIGKFDAIVGRRVLMYLPDPATTLRDLALLARPGAILAFQEHARSGLPAATAEAALHRQLYDWMWDTVDAEGGDTTLALRLGELMRLAGLQPAATLSEAVLLQPGAPSFLPALVQAMLPRMIAHGIASAGDVDLATLADRLTEEHSAIGGTIVWDLAFLVSARRSEC